MSKCCDCLTSEGMKNFGLLMLRLTVGGIFIYHGWGKLANMDPVITMFGENLQLPIPAVLAYLVAVGEFFGGIGLALGVLTRLAALGLAIIMLGAVLIVHLGNFDTMGELALALFGASMGLVASGGGKWKLWSNKCKLS